jgi:hypothetical protein
MGRAADEAALWVKRVAPDDDYLPPEEISRSIEQLPVARTPGEVNALEAFAADQGLTVGESWQFGKSWRGKQLGSDGKIATALYVQCSGVRNMRQCRGDHDSRFVP